MDLVPTSIKLAAPGGVAITWNDGHQATYSYAYLRKKCPCATCRDKPPEVKTESDPFPILGKGPIKVTGAAQIHTDIARGFVRAEVVGYEDFVRVGSMKEAKAQGVYRLEGKTYTVKDGDIMHILAST